MESSNESQSRNFAKVADRHHHFVGESLPVWTLVVMVTLEYRAGFEGVKVTESVCWPGPITDPAAGE